MKINNRYFFGTILIALYLALQIVGPRNEFALTPNFDTGCFSGAYSLIEKVSENSSCGAGPKGSLGFPFVLNFNANPLILNGLVFIADILPVLVLTFIMCKRYQKLKF